jgi:two-component system sensor histidine kinase MtrB
LLAGILFGTLFPLVGWIVATASGVDGIAAAHRHQPVLYIVDLAPLVLGVTGFGIGHYHARLVKSRLSVEQTVAARTAELRHTLDELSATQAEKDRFVAGVSHELRTPLTSVVGLARALAEPGNEFSDEEHDELLHLIVRESEEVASIVEDLLVASRIDRGQMNIASDPIRLDEELCAVVEVCEVDVKPTRIDPLIAAGDVVRVHQIIRNLITNADRYGGDQVAVSVFVEEEEAVVAVRDDGPGVPDDKRDLIFAAFGKAHDDPGRTESVGLGLAVSRNLARMMDGDVVYRRLGRWTSFELHLPLVAASTTDVPSDDDSVAKRIAQPHADRFRYAGKH